MSPITSITLARARERTRRRVAEKGDEFAPSPTIQV
jgi:hypothetical protein